MADEPVYHASLALAEYQAILRDEGAGLVVFSPEDPECSGHSVLLAKRG